MRFRYGASDRNQRIVYNQSPMDSKPPSLDENTKNNTTRTRLITAAKIAVTIIGLYLALQSLNLSLILETISRVEWGWMAAGAVLISFSLIVRAYRWHLLLAGLGSSVRFKRLVELYMVGSFFNAFLPSGFGGDVVRAAEAAQDVDADKAVGTVLVDRLTGLMALFAMALVMLAFQPAGFPKTLALLVAVICTTGLIIGIIVVDGRLFQHVIRILPNRVRALGNSFLDRLAETIAVCGWRPVSKALLVSVFFNLIQVGWWYTTGRALNLTIPYTYYLLVVPFMSLALLVPSIGGLGVRENLAPVIFAPAGISPEQAVALTLLVFGLERIASLLGAPVYVYSTLNSGRSPKSPDDYVPNGR